MCHINIRSLKANLGSFETCLANLNFEFTVIGVSETWLRDDNCDLYNLDGYHFTEVHRTCRSGGGVGIYVKNSIPFLNRRDLKVEDAISESVFIEIDKQIFNGSKNITIGVIYRPPGGNLQNFIDSVNTVLNGLRNENKLCFLLGDVNINLLNYEKHEDTTTFIDLMHSFSFISLINRPTRITENSATSIDNIFTNHYVNLDNSFQCVIYTDVSDHFPVIHIDTAMKLIKTEMSSSRRNMSFRNKQEFCLALSETDWGEIYNTTDTQEAFTKFHSVLTTVYTKHFPKITVLSKYNNRKPWLTQGLKNSI